MERDEALESAAIFDFVGRNLRPGGRPSRFGGGIALTDGTIHHQDIRRALGLRRSIPAHRSVPVLNFARRTDPAGEEER